jgi:enoyl-CoA hydratase/carnithine racemase
MFTDILYDVKEGIATITFNRPDVLNAVRNQLWKDVEDALAIVKEDTKVRALIITGAGKAFSAGADLKDPWLNKATSDLNELRNNLALTQKVTTDLISLGKPSIAAINGYAIGGGFEFALGCDIRIASEKAKFAFTEARVALFQSGGSTYFLPRLIGLAKTKELLFTCRYVDSIEAEKIGLVNILVPNNELLNRARELATQIIVNSPLSIRLAKYCIDKSFELSLDLALSLELEGMQTTLLKKDWQEGMKAFKEKRDPVYRDT